MKKKFTQFRWLAATLLFVAAMAMPKMAWAQVTTSQPTNGNGTAANPYQITTAAELAWFRDFVNAGNETACARLEANIDMSTVCHPANESESVAELSWVPIGNNSKRWHGEFKVTTKPFPIFTSTLRKHIQVFSDMLIIGMRVKEALSRI